jgi:uncharacterized protein (TIGR02145 family)
MDKTNQFKSSSFHMDRGDKLTMILLDEVGTPVTVDLSSPQASGVAPSQPIASPATSITSSGFTANWNLMENSTGYYLDVATDSAFTSFVAGFNNHDAGTAISHVIGGLGSQHQYYYRVRAYNSIGTSISSDTIHTTTLDEVVTDIDGNIYTYVTIGTQQWLRENLRVTRYADGTAIPNLSLDADWVAEDGTAGHDGAYCWYNNDNTDKELWGAMYNWYAVNNAKSLAPAGWRIATDQDVNDLGATIGGMDVAGALLKEAGSAHWDFNSASTDPYQFTAVPNGYRRIDGGFESQLGDAHWWSIFTPAVFRNKFYIDTPTADLFTNYITQPGFFRERFGFGVRCVRDL